MTAPRDPLDDLIRAHLERNAATVDAHVMLARVRPVEPPRPPARRRWLRWVGVGGGIAVAASVAALILFTGPPNEKVALAAAADILREAKLAEEAAPADRRYAMTAEWEATPFQKRIGFRPLLREGTIWTRGDQFVVLSTLADGETWALGQDAGGRVWLVPTRKRALVFEADEVGEPLARFCELLSLRVASTLGELLEKHELARRDSGKPGEPIHIVAQGRKPAPAGIVRLERVELFLDPKTKVVRRAVMTRQLNGETVARVEFALEEAANQPDAFYSPRGHVDPDGTILERKAGPQPKFDLRLRFRDELMKRFANREK